MTADEPLASNSDCKSIISFDTTDSEHSANADQPLPHDRVPTSYTIGGNVLIAPLVDLPYLKTHLLILRAFKDLRTAVEANLNPYTGKEGGWPKLAKKLSGPERWKWFVSHAVVRFQAWIQEHFWEPRRKWNDVSRWVRDEFPPIDVLMVWHAYMLNPRCYAEDCDRLNIIPAAWLNCPDVMLKAVTSLKVDDLIKYQPSEDRKRKWTSQTTSLFNLSSSPIGGCLQIQCPYCLRTETSVPYLADGGKGYLQAEFTAQCTNCRATISNERLAVLKFARDAVVNPQDERNAKYGLACYQAGTLWTEHNLCDRDGAQDVKDKLRKALAPVGDLTGKNVSSFDIVRNWSLEKLARQMQETLGESSARRVMSAYTDDKPFSVNLSAAVSRQCAFVDKMHDLGWTNPGRFDDEGSEMILTDAISRYHAFLDLLSVNPSSLFIPTLDIDLVWHTHQLLGSTYHTDCFTHIGRYLDHPDKIEGTQFADAFDDTCRAWQRRFGVPYTYCGCPLPGESSATSATSTTNTTSVTDPTIRERIMAMFGGAQPASSDSCPAPQMPNAEPLVEESCPAFVPQAPQWLDARAATHASEHNAEFAEDALRRACSGWEVQQQLERADRETFSVGTACAKTVCNGNADTKTVYNGYTETETLCHEKTDIYALCDGAMDAEEETLCDGQTDMDAETLCDEKTDTANGLQLLMF